MSYAIAKTSIFLITSVHFQDGLAIGPALLHKPITGVRHVNLAG